MDRIIKYFEKSGPQNTDETIIAARKRAEELNIKHIVVATRVGDTAVKVGELFEGLETNIVAISHQYGFFKPGEWLIEEEMLRKLRELGVKVFTCTMLLTSPGRLYRPNRKSGSPYPIYNTIFPFDVMADTLRMFCQGMKVCVEIAVMAADMGAISINEEIISITGTRRGADTAVVIKPAHSHKIYDLRILEIIAKPRLAHVSE
jgi:hypothetical protein